LTYFFFQAEDGIRDFHVTGVQTCALPIYEIQILKSKSLTERVVKELHLNVSYVSEGKVRDTELYENVPIKVEIITPEDEIIFPATPLYVLPINSKKYQLTVENVLEGAELDRK